MDLPEFGPDDDITVEEIEHEAPATNSSFARRVALQVLYEMDATNHRPGEIMTARLEAQDTDRRETRYVRRLVQGFVANRTAIDDVIRPFVQGWPLEQIASIDRNILRLAVMELIEQRVSISVVIDEAVGLANIFGTENSIGFINGVLGQLVADDRVLETLRTLKTDGDAL
jgi:N utilization substance protein B